ncbi:hypothetical protein [Rubellimicrobium roseum]|uniref:hypothetical protein n=1 Tax=Rubellimicrobium roseum TaxID=687525 RepID=UPI00159BE5CB|nr:hypothetical protein [Rubellimicrobium roseum]
MQTERAALLGVVRAARRLVDILDRHGLSVRNGDEDAIATLAEALERIPVERDDDSHRMIDSLALLTLLDRSGDEERAAAPARKASKPYLLPSIEGCGALPCDSAGAQAPGRQVAVAPRQRPDRRR